VRAVVGLLLLSLIGCTLDVLAGRAAGERRSAADRLGAVVRRAVRARRSVRGFLGAGGLLPATPARR